MSMIHRVVTVSSGSEYTQLKCPVRQAYFQPGDQIVVCEKTQTAFFLAAYQEYINDWHGNCPYCRSKISIDPSAKKSGARNGSRNLAIGSISLGGFVAIGLCALVAIGVVIAMSSPVEPVSSVSSKNNQSESVIPTATRRRVLTATPPSPVSNDDGNSDSDPPGDNPTSGSPRIELLTFCTEQYFANEQCQTSSLIFSGIEKIYVSWVFRGTAQGTYSRVWYGNGQIIPNLHKQNIRWGYDGELFYTWVYVASGLPPGQYRLEFRLDNQNELIQQGSFRVE